MSYQIKVDAPTQEPAPARKPLRLKPAGWLALIVVVVLVVSGLGLAVQTLLRSTQSLADLPTAQPVATYTPAPTLSPTVGPTATPQGWTLQRDPLTGEEYLSPPPDVEAQVREAFEAVIGCILIEDVPDEVALQYDREAAINRAAAVAAPEVLSSPYFQPKVAGTNPGISLALVGPENPVRCKDYGSCSVGLAKVGTNGAIIYFNEGPFVARPSRDGYIDSNPYMLYVAAVERQENDTWKVANLQYIELAEPPAEPPQS